LNSCTASIIHVAHRDFDAQVQLENLLHMAAHKRIDC